MKTLIIYNTIEKALSYAIVEGDFTRFNNVCVNSTEGNGFENEFCEFVFDEEGNFKINFVEDLSLLENKQWDKVAVATFLP